MESVPYWYRMNKGLVWVDENRLLCHSAMTAFVSHSDPNPILGVQDHSIVVQTDHLDIFWLVQQSSFHTTLDHHHLASHMTRYRR